MENFHGWWVVFIQTPVTKQLGSLQQATEPPKTEPDVKPRNAPTDSGAQTPGVAWRIFCTPAQQFNTFATRKLLEIKECRTYHRIWSARRLAVVRTGGQRPGLCAPGRSTWRCCPCCPQPPPTTSTFLGLLFLVSVHVVRMNSQWELWETILFIKVAAGVCTFLLVWNNVLLSWGTKPIWNSWWLWRTMNLTVTRLVTLR